MMTLKLRATDLNPRSTIRELNQQICRDCGVLEGRHARKPHSLTPLRELFARASGGSKASHVAKISELRRDAPRRERRPDARGDRQNGRRRRPPEVRRIHMLEADLGRVVRMIRSPDAENRSLRGLLPRSNRSSRCSHFRSQILRKRSATLGPELSLEHKLDGARVQIHHAAGRRRGVSSRAG